MGLTLGQQKLLAILPKLTGLLSLLGSGWISIEVLSEPKKLQKVYHRLVLAMSLYDVMQSIWFFASTWPIPADTPNVYGASGNRGSCIAQGFFIQMGLAVPIYNTCLAVFYLLVIKYRMSEDRIRTYVEPMFHGTALAMGLGTALSSLALGLLNNANVWCWIAPYPLGCLDSRRYGETNCIRGDNAWIYRWAFYIAPLWFCIVLVMILMAITFHSVHRIELAASRYAYSSANVTSGRRRRSSSMSSTATNVATSPASLRGSTRRRSSILQRTQINIEGRRSREVANQAFWYVGAFYITFFFPTLNRILQQSKVGTKFGMLVMHVASFPSQGIFNFIVYRRPRFIRLKRDNPNLNIFQVIFKAMKFSYMTRDNKNPSSEEGHASTRQTSAAASRRNSFGVDHPTNGIPKGEFTVTASSLHITQNDYDIESSTGRPLAGSTRRLSNHSINDDDNNTRRVNYQFQPEALGTIVASSRSSDSGVGTSSTKTPKKAKFFDAFTDDDFVHADSLLRPALSERQSHQQQPGRNKMKPLPENEH